MIIDYPFIFLVAVFLSVALEALKVKRIKRLEQIFAKSAKVNIDICRVVLTDNIYICLSDMGCLGEKATGARI